MNFGDFFRHITLVFASYLGLLGIPMPLPVPPQPEDPALLRVAPADVALFVEWFGRGELTELPKNRTERLAAEPEVRTAISRLLSSGRGMVAQQGRSSGELPAALALFDQAAAAFERPGSVFVTTLRPFAGGLVLQCGADAQTTSQAVTTALVQLLPKDMLQEKTIAGVAFQVVQLPDEQFAAWAAIDDYFVMAVGDAAVQQIVAGIRGQHQGLRGDPAVAKLLASCKVERPMLRTYASFERIVAQVPFADKFWQPLGLSNVDAALAESGLEGDGFVSRTMLQTEKPVGLLANLRGRPLSQDDLELIPNDATTVIALRTAAGTLERSIIQAVMSLSSKDPSQDWEQSVAQGVQQLDVNMRDDLVAHLDDCIVLWNSPRQGGLGFTSAVASLPMRNAKQFGENLTAMWDKLTDIAPNKAKALAEGQGIRTRVGYLGNFEHGGTKVWWLDHVDRDLPFGISWTSTERHALFAMQPQAMRSAIDDSLLPNFDTALVRKPLVARRGNANAMIYLDLQALLRQSYGALLMLFQTESHEWQSEGFGFDLADVPRLESVAKHLGPELTVLEEHADGFLLTRRGSLPVFDVLLVTCGVACSLFH